MKSRHIIVYIYNSFKDPLFQNLVFSYIKTLSRQKCGCTFHLITHEQEAYALTRQEAEIIHKILQIDSIYWYPLKHRTGSFLLVKKLIDFLRSFLLILSLKIRYRIEKIFCFANIAASFGLFYSKLLKMDLVVYSYEPHSAFMLELGVWKASSLKYRLLHKVEEWVGKYATHIMTGTKWMVEELKKRKTRAKVYRAPTAVDPNVFLFDQQIRQTHRKEHGWVEKAVFLYAGKFGGLYYTEEVFSFFRRVKQRIAHAHLLVVSRDNKEMIIDFAEKYLDSKDYTLREARSAEEMASWISAADIGINAIPPTDAQKFRSPTKVAEYITVGIPYISTEGISEDDSYARDYQIGAVTPSLSGQPSDSFYNELEFLLTENKNQQVARIRKVGLEYRSKEHINRILKAIFC
ncbi:hypothetical protein [Ekhidna sp.]|uniref:hypothetical protein n=1 Tax=Ekhidna sp. TaxID=2608089 RepID=UPI003CCBBF68